MLEVESFASDYVNFLDVTLFRSDRFRSAGKLDYKVFTKMSSQWVPLTEQPPLCCPQSLAFRHGSKVLAEVLPAI